MDRFSINPNCALIINDLPAGTWAEFMASNDGLTPADFDAIAADLLREGRSLIFAGAGGEFEIECNR